MMKGQLAGLMQQAQKMQEGVKRLQEELANTEVEGQSGAGMVKVVMTCKHDVRRVAIDPSLVGDDKDMLEDLVAAAFNDAVRRAEAVSQEKDVRHHRRHAVAARHEAAVLSSCRGECDPACVGCGGRRAAPSPGCSRTMRRCTCGARSRPRTRSESHEARSNAG